MVLYAHSWNRWLVLIAGGLALTVSYRGWLGRRVHGRAEAVTSRAFGGILDLQVLLGLTLYALSPTVRIALGDLGIAMTVRELRFFSIEHITGMLIAVAFVHVGTARAHRATTAVAKFRNAVLWQTLAAISIAVSIPWWRPLFRS